MYNELFIATTFLALLSVCLLIFYYNRTKKVNKKIENASNIVNDIIISYNEQLRGIKKRVSDASNKTASQAMNNYRVSEELKKYQQKMIDLTKAKNGVSQKVEAIDKTVEDLSATQKRILEKIERIETTKHTVPLSGERIEGVIPIRKEKVLAPLTKTELLVLELLVEKGRMTAPDVKDEIKLTREHTARLMKKLYDTGYLERETRKLPYYYSIKEEMVKILQKVKGIDISY